MKSKRDFCGSNAPENHAHHSSKMEGKIERAGRKEEGEEKKSNGRTLVFIMASLEIVLERQKSVWAQGR